MSTGPDTSRAGFARMAAAALDGLPEVYAKPAQEVVVQVVDWPPRAILREMGIRDPLDLTGLYEGVPLTRKSSLDQPFGPDLIWLFREPILNEWRERGNIELEDLVRHVLVHELAHHFGWSDDDIAVVDRWWE